VNVICVIGLLIGVLAMMLPWASDSGTNLWNNEAFSQEYYLRSGFVGGWSPESQMFMAASYLFLIGTILGLVSPIAFSVQLGGLIAFGFFWSDHITAIHDFLIISHQYEFGLYMGIVSAVVVFASFLRPVMIGDAAAGIAYSERLLTIRWRHNREVD